MKFIKIIITLTALAGFGFSQRYTQQGVFELKPQRVTYTSNGDEALLLLNDNVYSDSANSGTWVRSDNTADSCSQPLDVIESGAGGGQGPTWKMELCFTVDGESADSNHSFQVNIESRKYTNPKRTTFTGWIPYTLTKGDAANTFVVDSLNVPDNNSASADWQCHLFFTVGHQVRFCPVELAATDNDSIFIDSLYFYRQ